MHHKFVLILAVGLFFIQCKKNETEQVVEEIVGEPYEVISPSHEARLALDYTGRYEGIVPCADCEGIETVLTLVDTVNFVLETKYLGKPNTDFQKIEGMYNWSEKNNVIRLNGITDRPNMFFVGENYLIQLNMMGERITGELETAYFLKKQINTSNTTIEVEKSQSKMNVKSLVNDPKLINTKWKLVELKGKKVKYSDANNPYTLEFFEGGRIAAFAGCNRMMGSFDQKPVLQIKFSKIASTLMACADMETEAVFKIVLEEVDNFALNDDKLSLNKARMAPLARFEKFN
jgi:copper homeostasis protein (lipoprotein)